MARTPLVTVYIPTYNRLDLLKRAINSVLEQDYPCIEIIVVDDVSSDGTINYLKVISEKDPRIRFFVNEVNSGACASRNKAIAEARGEFVTGLDDDDYFLANRVGELLDCYFACPDKGVLFTDIVVKNNKKAKVTKKPKVVTSKMLISENFIGNQIFFCRKRIIEKELFDVSFPALQDLEAWYTILKKYDLKAYKVGSPSYVMDIGHEENRISKNIDKILRANKLFVKKHKLEGKERFSFEAGIKSYMIEKVGVGDIYQSFFRGSGYTVFKLAKLWVKKYARRLA